MFPARRTPQKIGILSDTHGLLRPPVVTALHGVDLIVHAGDVGSPHVLQELRTIAPIVAVRGNTDLSVWAEDLPETAVAEVDGILMYILHDLHRLDLDPGATGFRIVVHGHSHQPSLQWRQEVLFLNPGSAGPRRFRLPVAIALLHIRGPLLCPEIVVLEA
jgi:putative phosphoesterase